MNKIIYILSLLFIIQFSKAQETAFEKMIDTTLQKTVDFISVEKLRANYNDYLVLDARELEEYQTSHLKNARFIGYKKFKLKKVTKSLLKDKPIVVYCSIGYRSEKIAKKLQRKGYTVYNLYGGIFDWKNKNNTVIDSLNQPTQNVHTFNEEWSKWLKNGTKIHKKELKKN